MNLFNVLLSIVLIIGPGILIFLTSRSKILDKIGVVLLSYIVGIIIGNSGLTGADTLSLQKSFSEISVAIALPLLLFSIDIKTAFKNAGRALFALLLAALSVAIVGTLLFFWLGNSTNHASELAGMAVAVYTGGTPNLAAVKTALQVPDEIYIKFHTYDTVIGLFYLLFVFSFARPFFSRFMKSDDSMIEPVTNSNLKETDSIGIEEYGSLIYPKSWPPILLALVLSLAIVGISDFIGSMFPANSTAITILLITSLAIAASFFKFVRNLRKAFSVGMYIILIFCISVASLTDAAGLLNIDPVIAAYVAGGVFGGMFLHAALCKLAKIDVDTYIIVSVSAICSPPFVPAAADAINRRNLIPIGLTTGIIGYGIGNYLGISLAYLLSSL